MPSKSHVHSSGRNSSVRAANSYALGDAGERVGLLDGDLEVVRLALGAGRTAATGPVEERVEAELARAGLDARVGADGWERGALRGRAVAEALPPVALGSSGCRASQGPTAEGKREGGGEGAVALHIRVVPATRSAVHIFFYAQQCKRPTHQRSPSNEQVQHPGS